MLTLGSVVLRVTFLDVQQRFWSRALDYVPRTPHDDDFVVLEPRFGSGSNLSLDARPSHRTIPPRLHLDLYAADAAAEVERLVGLGAIVVPWDAPHPEVDYVVMEDPEGNRFCVVDASGEIAEW